MKRKDYKKPTMEIVLLKSAQLLLTASNDPLKQREYESEEW